MVMARLRHFAVCVKDLDKAAEFYANVFDLKRIGREDLDIGSAIYMSDGVINLALLNFKGNAGSKASDIKEGATVVGAHHFGFQVDDLAEIEEELAAIGLDPLLRFGEIIDLKAEMMGADMGARIFQIRGFGARGAGEIEQSEIDDAVAHIDRGADVQILAADAFELEHVLIEFRRFLQILHADGKMAQPGHGPLLVQVFAKS